ncbi:hypothetical protein L3i23_14050 [Herbiconiux sp. L3-i23]|nr:hypothetical protein L3i23_14050 [Herbiconiux sp. L3-i23]
MRLWYRSVDQGPLGTLPQPTDEPRGHAPGPSPIRALLIGNGPAVGLGVASHELALPGQIARHLGAATGRGVDVIAVVDRDLRVGDVVDRVPARAIRRSQLAVVVIGGPEALTFTPLSEWCDGIDRIIAHLRADDPALPILFVGPYPFRSMRVFDSRLGAIGERRAVRLNRLGAGLVADHEGIRWFSLPPNTPGTGDRFRTSRSYEQWGKVIADELDSTVFVAAVPNETGDDEGDRAVAVAAFRKLTESATPDLDKVVDLAQRMFGTAGAAITLVDDERQWVGASTGIEMAGDGLDRASSICARTIEQDDVMVVPDTAGDERFARTTVAERVRFYMGYPLNSPDGHRLGALCVYDPEPRTDRTDDPSLLREIGLLAQRALWSLAEGAKPARTDAAPGRRD